jgi:hypothetical protein
MTAILQGLEQAGPGRCHDDAGELKGRLGIG